MPSVDALLSPTVILAFAAVITLVLVLVMVWLTVGARRAAAVRLAIAARVAPVSPHAEGHEPVPPVESDDLEPYRWSLAVREDALGPDHPDVATACHILGAMYLERERYTEAEPLLERALDIRTRAFGPSHGDVALALDDLAALYRAQGRGIEADSLREGLRASQSPAATASVSDNGDSTLSAAPVSPPTPKPVEHAAGTTTPRDASGPLPPKPEVASPGASTAPAKRSDSEELARVLREIAGLRDTDAEPASAQQLYRRALAMMEATGANDRPELRIALRELGRLYYRQGAYAEAEPLLERALALTQRALGADAPAVAEIRDDLAWLRFSRRSLG
jgi:tetratricopeptide (TPR) repeat protein